ncbi:MAG TPA: thiopeptide-type bacteriocin biosynthesis protein, partial [Ktedonobacteraceae bacterium]|nr:thiopeptide-type bacteriocin biosynthesis protein [Ktedonobacteraceae bacterium]
TIQPQGTGTPEACLFQGVQHWRKCWRVPRYAYLTEADNRLLLDLENPLMVTELFESLKRLKEGQQVTLQELLPDFEHLWLTDVQGAPYFSEIVVPLLRRDAFASQSSTTRQANTDAFHNDSPLQTSNTISYSHAVSQQVRVFSPGDVWNYVKLYCTPAQQEEIIASPLRDLIRQLRERQLIDRWFFLRYADPQPHLRLRIHTHASEQIQAALHLLLSWSRQLAAGGLIQRFVLDTYEREVARYGGPAAIDLLEEVFSVDSDICSSIVAAQYIHRLTLEPLAIAVASLDRFFAVWGYDREQRLQWLRRRVEKYAFRKEFHSKRKHYCELLVPCEKYADAELTTQRALLYELMAPLENQLPPLVTQIRHFAQTGQLWVAEEDLLASLAHMHKVRLLDLDTHKEQQMYAFWHHALESIRLRQREHQS